MRQLYSVATSTKGRIVVGDLITFIIKSLGVKPNPKDKVSRSEQLDKAAFEVRSFCKVEVGCLCSIYLGIRLFLFLMVPKLPF